MMCCSRQSRIRKNLFLRAKILDAIRRFFTESGYLEVETPCRIPAPAPEAHIDAEPSGNWFLHSSPELSMKRLIAAGFPRLYQICKCFRKNERGPKHLPEMTLLEWYTAGMDYVAMMDQCEELLEAVAESLGLDQILTYQAHSILLARPWDRITVRRAFEKYTSTPMDVALHQDRFDEIMACDIEPNLGTAKPVFLYDYPAQFGSLAKKNSQNPLVAERFELYINGIELCNAFTELTDAAEQRQRFDAENHKRRSLGKHEYPVPEKFLTALKQMPATAGNALGIDRLVMLFADTPRIDDVVAFTPEEL
jgi:lysyl-tRNA synthetase class 2